MEDSRSMGQAKRKASAADYMNEHSRGVSIILGEMAESAGAVVRSWNQALSLVDTNPDEALGHLTDAEVRLDNFVRLELADTLRPIRRAISLLDEELTATDPGGE